MIPCRRDAIRPMHLEKVEVNIDTNLKKEEEEKSKAAADYTELVRLAKKVK